MVSILNEELKSLLYLGSIGDEVNQSDTRAIADGLIHLEPVSCQLDPSWTEERRIDDGWSLPDLWVNNGSRLGTMNEGLDLSWT